MKKNKFEIGDLVRLKGFKVTKPEDVPYGMVIYAGKGIYYGRGSIKVKWLNKDVADRYVLTSYVLEEKLELLQKAQSEE